MSELDPRLENALAAARGEPANEAHWDELEDLAGKLQRPDEVGELYREVLAGSLPQAAVAPIGQRAVGFHEEWFGDEPKYIVEVLTRILALDPTADWALQRATVVLTVREKWNELLSLYDRALEAATDAYRRSALLEEAAQLAKDFAGQPDRAVRYLRQLLELRPDDAQLEQSIERLLERLESWTDLVALWRRRLELHSGGEAPEDIRLRIASTFESKVGDPAAALAEARSMIDDGIKVEEALAIVERILANESAPALVREGALEVLRARYVAGSRNADVERVLAVALTFSPEGERIGLHRELGRRAEERGDPAAALEHWAAVLGLDPTDETAEERLVGLADASGAHERLAEALEAASRRATQSSRRVGLLLSAGDVRARADRLAAEALYREVLDGEGVAARFRRDAARRLSTLLDVPDRRNDRLAALERQAELEGEDAERRRVLGLVARLATELGEIDRALGGWQRRLSADPSDVEALEARIGILESAERHAELAEALTSRAALPMPTVLRRDDLVRAARVQAGPLAATEAAIETWRRVEAEFGEDRESVDALSELYARANLHAEHAAALDRAASRDAARAVDVLSRLAAVRGEALGEPDAAATGFLRAIQLDARHAGARAGLERLLTSASGTARSAAIEGLADAALRTDDVPALLSLLAPRLEVAENDRSRLRILREAARLEEERRGDASAAFDRVGAAFALAPDEEQDERELVRLGDATGRHAETIASLGAAARAVEAKDTARSAHLHRRTSTLAEEKLGDFPGALAAITLAFGLEPHDGAAARRVVDLSARLGDWDRAATTWIDHQLALRRYDADLTARLESAAQAASAWDPLSAAADAVLAARTASLGGDPAALRAAGVADLVRALEDRLAVWHRDKRGDLAKAESALSRALAYAPTDVETLRELSRLQYRQPSKALVTTLVTLAQELPGDLDALHDAARIAKDLGDPVLVRELLAKLFRAAERLWQRGEPARGERPADRTALEAHGELVRLEVEAGRFKNAVDWLVEGARLPVAPAERRALLRRAGDIAREKLGDDARAMQLYQSVVDDSLEDAETVDRLAVMYEQRGRVPELLALKKRELELDLSPDRKLDVRLVAARLLGNLEEKGGRVELLRQNLTDRPGHAESIVEITNVLEQKGKGAELAEVLGQQARRLEESDGVRAAGLWTQVAKTAETRLSDSDRAIGAWRRVVALAPASDAYDALSRLHLSRNEPGQAAEWLEKRFDAAKGSDRTAVALRLADARIGAERLDRAIVALERALAEDATAHEVREKLLGLYRQTDEPAPLAKTLADGVPHVAPEQQLVYVREAQALYRQRLGQPAAAVAILELVHQRGEADQELRGALAEGYLASGRLDEARALLEAIVTEFGRRRSADRALVHFQLARVAQAAGDLKEALDQLDKASSMDLAHAGILRLLGQLAREAGQADRSERAYRALLLLVRRQSPDAEDVDVGQAEVLWELSRLAKDKKQDAQARELHESAIEVARAHPAEAARFTAVLLARGDAELAERIIDARLEGAEGTARAKALADRAVLLDKLKGQPEPALAARLEALDLAPEWKDQTTAALELARRTGNSARFAETLARLLDRSRRKEDSGFASDLLLRLGDVLENDVNDLAGAADAYGKAEALGLRTVDAWRALGRVAQKRGDRIEEIRVLRRLVAAGIDTAELGSGEHEIPEGAQTDALYRIAEVELKSDDTIESGLDTLADAVKRDGDHARAAAIARSVSDRMGNHDGLLSLWERASRQSGKDDELLAYLEHRVQKDGASLEDVREGADLAVKLGAPERAEVILERGVEIAKARLDGLSGAIWVLTALADRRRNAGDVKKAIEWTQMGIEAADQAGEPQKRDALLKDLATLAGGEGGDPTLAAETYARLLDVDAKDRSLWAPMTAAFKKVKDRKGWEEAMRRGVDTILDPADRSALRMALADGLRVTWKKEDEAIAVLREVLDDDPDHLDAGAALGEIYQRRDMHDELRELLARQLDRARDRSDAKAVVALSLRTAALYGPDQRADAMDVYRSALDWAPEDADVLRALYALYGPDDDARDRATLGEKLLAVEVPGKAAALAIDVADQLTALEDEGAALTALATGFRTEPTHAGLRERLEASYRSRDDIPGLAEMITQDAGGRTDAAAAVARYREAAALWMQISSPEKAADVLGAAMERSPADATLLDERVAALEASGRAEEGLAAVATALESARGAHRANLLRASARLRIALGDADQAVVELEEALTIDPAGTADALGAALEVRRDAARDRSDRDAERAASLRLVEVLDAGGDADGARLALAAWTERDERDVEAWRALRDRDVAAGRWSDVVPAAARLIELETGEAQARAALTLADAARRVGSPEIARAGLERAYVDQPERAELRDSLRGLYEASGAWAELAELLLGDAEATTGDARFESLRRAGDLLVNQVGQPARAIDPLRAAQAMKPDDLDLLSVLVDAMMGGDQLAEAVEILQNAINQKGRKRSPQLAALQLRMGRIAGISGDAQTQLEWVKVALDTDKTNGAIAAEVAELAIQLGDDAVALNALKVVTLQKTPGPMSKAVAFLRQAQIAHKQGDHQKAVLWARRARIEDAELAEAESFLGQLGEG